MKTHDAPQTTEEHACQKCGANRQALFALAKAQKQVARYNDKKLAARQAIAACPLCWAAWVEAHRA